MKRISEYRYYWELLRPMIIDELNNRRVTGDQRIKSVGLETLRGTLRYPSPSLTCAERAKTHKGRCKTKGKHLELKTKGKHVVIKTKAKTLGNQG